MLTELVRYGIVGLASNGFGYLLYLGLTYVGAGPKFAMSLLYGVGVLQTFLFNRKWSFSFDGAATPSFVRYATVYAIGYVIQYAAMLLLVDKLGWPHQWVMGALVLFMAMFFFVAQKFWVFRPSPAPVLDHGL